MRAIRSLPAEALPGLALLLCAAAAMWLANGHLADAYEGLLATPLGIAFGEAGLAMPLADWVKNGLMAVFFLYAGLELKRELLEGALADRATAMLPLAGALGGMAAPALIYLAVAGPTYAHGWAVPAATDIAFALGVLALLGSRVPPGLKAFLLAVAVVDDMGAILVIALFYTAGVQALWLAVAAGVFAVMLALNRWGTGRLGIYCLLAVPLWLAVHASGVNPTVAGVLTALAIPMRDRRGDSPLLAAEHAMRPYVLFGIMPLFALGSAGARLGADAAAVFAHPVALGAGLGLAVGKPLGITVMILVAAKLLRTPPPGRVVHLIGLGSIAGIGFTMSLFIAKLAFPGGPELTAAKIGVYAGSVVAAGLGLIILGRTLPRRSKRRVAADRDETRPFIAQTPDAPPGNTPF